MKISIIEKPIGLLLADCSPALFIRHLTGTVASQGISRSNVENCPCFAKCKGFSDFLNEKIFSYVIGIYLKTGLDYIIKGISIQLSFSH